MLCGRNCFSDHLPVCSRKTLQKNENKAMADSLSKYLTSHKEQTVTDDPDSDDSNASGGVEFDEEK